MKKLFSIFLLFFIVFFYPQKTLAQNTYTPINISSISNLPLENDYKDFPTGEVIFNEVPFIIGESGNNFLATRNLACLSCPDQGFISGLSIAEARNAWILVNSSDTFKPLYENVNFASIYFLFSGGEEFQYDFITGKNIREWLQSGNYGQTVNTVTSLNSKEVWRGFRPNALYSPNGEFPVVTDLLRIPIPSKYNDKILQGVFIYDQSLNRINSQEPGLILKGITIEQGVPPLENDFSISSNWDGRNGQVPIDRTAKITVKVTDMEGAGIADTLVTAEVLNTGVGSLDRLEATTVENGEAYFAFDPATAAPAHFRFTVDGVQKEFDLNVYRPPVVIVPGMGASMNLPKFLQNIPLSDAFWTWSPTAEQGWDDILATLQSNGYGFNSGYTIAFYDWRKTLRTDAYPSGTPEAIQNGLLPAINRVMQGRPAGQQVNILAHSYGGIVSRAFLKHDNSDRVNRLITLGTPHQGSSNMFYVWWGGTMPPTGDPMFRVIVDSILKIYKNKNVFQNLEGIRNTFQGFWNLLPTYHEYVHTPTFTWQTLNLSQQNDILWNEYRLNDFRNLIQDRNIAFTAFYATGEPTLRSINVEEPLADVVEWVDGKPLKNQTYESGDNSVPIESGWIEDMPAVELVGEHGDVPDLALGQVKQLLKIGAVSSTGKKAAKNMLGAVMLSPATVQIVSPDGTVVGSSEVWDETAGTKFAYASDLVSGLYTLRVTGTGNGNYTLYVPFAGEEVYSSTEITGTTTTGKIENYPLFIDTASDGGASLLVKADMDVRLGGLNIPRRLLPVTFVFDAPKKFDVAQLKFDELLVNGKSIPVLSHRTNKNTRKVEVTVNGADLGQAIEWNDRELVLNGVLLGEKEGLTGEKRYRINWGLYRRFF